MWQIRYDHAVLYDQVGRKAQARREFGTFGMQRILNLRMWQSGWSLSAKCLRCLKKPVET